jgi:hypothetical protein
MTIGPNARMPAIIDHDTPDGPLPVFESGPGTWAPGTALIAYLIT